MLRSGVPVSLWSSSNEAKESLWGLDMFQGRQGSDVRFRRSAELTQEIEEADELMTANDVTTRFDGAVVLAEFDECN